VTNLCVGGSYLLLGGFYEEESDMENSETKSTIQTAARETTESARKLGERLQKVAAGAADSSVRAARRCGEILSRRARLTTLQANQRVLQTRLNRAYRELGRAVYLAQGKGEQASALAEAPELQAALQQVKESEATFSSNDAELAELRQAGARGDSASSE
jgi:hypothetical protein